MPVEVACPNCGAAYVLESSALGEEFLCPGCMTKVDISPETAAPVSAEAPASTPTSTAAPAPSAVAVASATTPSVTTEEIVCPRCQLHFVPKRKHVAAIPQERPRVLIVEEMGYFRTIAEQALAAEYDVRTASDVPEAEAALATGEIDLLVLDLALTGGEHGRVLLRNDAGKPCPILIYTSQDESEIYGERWDELRELGADDIVIKGMNVAESLSRKVAELLGRPWGTDEDELG